MAKRDFAFGKENFVWIAAAIVCIIFGFLLMSGGGSGDSTFNPEIFSARRIVLAHRVTEIGYVTVIWGNLRKGESNAIAE